MISECGKKELVFFFGTLVILSSLLLIAAIQQESFMGGSKILGVFIMWIPGIAAILALLFCGRGFKQIGWKLGKRKYLIISYSLPICYILTAHLVALAFDFIRFVPEKFNLQILIMLVFGPIINIIAALGEEIGWRGFLLPRLNSKYGFTKTSLIIGVIWAVWHFPLILFTDFYSGQHQWLALAGFTVYTISITFVYNWLWLASGSIWVVSLLHAVNNFYALNIGVVFETVESNAELIISDTGIGIPLICVLIAILFWKLRRRLQDPRSYLI